MIGLALLGRIMATEGMLVTAALLFFLLHGVWLFLRSRARAILRARGRASLARLLAGTGADRAEQLAILHDLPVRVQIPLLAELSRNLAGEPKLAIRIIAGDLGLSDRARADCRSRRWRRRLRGARFLAQIGEPDPLVLPLLCDPHPAVRAQAAEWAGTEPTDEVVASMLELLADPATQSRFAVQDALLRMGEIIIEPLADFLSRHEGPAVLAGLRVAAASGDRRYLATALAHSYSSGDEAAVSAELLASIGGSETAERLVAMLEHESELAQLAAIRGIGRMRHWPAASRLASLLAHPRWKVRHAAALSLRTIGGPGLLLLRRARESSVGDASEIARLVLDLPAAVR